MEHVMLPLLETQVIDLLRKLSPESKRVALHILIQDVDDLEFLTEYGNVKIRGIAQERGIDWDTLSEAQREQLIDQILHEE